MVHYSLLIPQRDSVGAFARMLPRLCQSLRELILPYEIICIDDASPAPAANTLEELLGDYPPLRVLRFDRPRGTSAALSAGIAAARGDLIVALDVAMPGLPRLIPELISRLSQYDLVFAENEPSLASRLCGPLSRLPRLLAAHPQRREDEPFLWAARREAIGVLALAPGAFRVLPGLVARRGYRVCRLTLATGLPPQGAPYVPRVLERAAIGWLGRRFEPHLAAELRRDEPAVPQQAVARDLVQPRFVPRPAVLPADEARRESA